MSSDDSFSFNMDVDDPNGLNSTKKERTETLALIEKYKSINITDLNDLKEFMLAQLQGQLRTTDQIQSIKHNLKITKAAVSENAAKIADLQAANHDLQSNVTVLKQKEFDKEVILSGFPDLPNEPKILESIGKKFPQSMAKIIKSDSWASNRNNVKRGFMAITFIDKSSQIQFMKDKIANGPVYLSELTELSNQEQDTTIIYFSNRLSKDNQDISRKIRELQKNRKIAKSRFRNCQFEVQINVSSEFVPVPSLQFLINLTE